MVCSTRSYLFQMCAFVCCSVLQRVAACCREELDSVQYAQLSVSDVCVCVFLGYVCILTH